MWLRLQAVKIITEIMHSRRLRRWYQWNGLSAFDFYWLNASACDRKHCITVSTDNEIYIYFLLGWYYYIGLLIRKGGPKYRFAYVTIRGKSGPVYCTEREQNSIYIINIIIDFSQARIQALSNTPINHWSCLHCEMNILLTSYAHL